MRGLRKAASRLGDLGLTLVAVVGGVCLLLTLAGVLGGFSLIMFSTGSMSPTIPAGSVALIREIPAAEVRIGDIVTVDRPGQLPITHRVRVVGPAPGDRRLLTLRGDANADDDLEPYLVSSVRIVWFSIPGAARAIGWAGHPFVLGGVTLAVAVLVGWAFWPRSGSGRAAPTTPDAADPAVADGSGERDQRDGGSSGELGASSQVKGRRRSRRRVDSRTNDPEDTVALAVLMGAGPADRTDPDGGETGRSRAPGGPITTLVVAAAAIGLGVAVLVSVTPPAQAEVTERVIRGDVITLIAVGDREAMTSLAPGQPVTWQVGVASNPPDPGQIDLTLRATGGLAVPGGLQLRLDSCPERWRAGSCGSGGSAVLGPGPAARYTATPVRLGRMDAGAQRWLQVTAWLPVGGSQRDGRADVRVTAIGFGDRVDTGSGPLPQTGNTAEPYTLAVAAGLLLAGAVLVRRGAAP